MFCNRHFILMILISPARRWGLMPAGGQCTPPVMALDVTRISTPWFLTEFALQRFARAFYPKGPHITSPPLGLMTWPVRKEA